MNPWDTPEARAWARDVADRMIPAMRDSQAVVPMWHGEIDVKFAVEIGAAVLLDKPLIVVVASGTPVPDKLARIADRILEEGERSPAGRRDLADRLTAAMTELLEERGLS